MVIGYSLAQAPDIGFNIAHPSIKTCHVLLKPGNVLLKPGNIARHALKAAALLGLRHDDLPQHGHDVSRVGPVSAHLASHLVPPDAPGRARTCDQAVMSGPL